MLNHIQADIYRITKKRSFYLMMMIFTIGFTGMSFLFRNDGVMYYQQLVMMIASFSPILIGIFVFSVTYSDDLKSHSMQTAIGFGTKRTDIVLTKFIEAILLLIYFHIYALLHVFVVAAIFNFKLDANFIRTMSIYLSSNFLLILALYAISSILIFSVQVSTVSLSVYLLLSLGLIDQILSLVLTLPLVTRVVGDLSPYLLQNVQMGFYVNMLNGLPFIKELIILVTYIVGALALSITLFNKVELEF